MKKISAHIFWALALVLLVINSCKKDKECPCSDAEMGYTYYPLDSGLVRIYAVDSIAYDDNTQSVDTFNFQLKEIIGGTVSGQDNQVYTIISRFARKDSTESWEARDVFFAAKTPNALYVVDNNEKIVKLVFPLGNVTSWNGYMYLPTGSSRFQLKDIYKSFQGLDTIFPVTVTVQEQYVPDNIIEEILIKSIYSPGIGLVDFTNVYLNTQQSGTSGYRVRQQLIDYQLP